MIFIICATGPSVDNMDWDKLKEYKKLGINQFFRKGIVTDYYYIYDKMCLYRENPNFTSVLNEWPQTTFYIDQRIDLPTQFRHNTNIVRTKSRVMLKEEINNFDHWARALDQPFYMNRSTVTGAINIAHILGATTIYIAGLDGKGGYFYPHKKNMPVFKKRLHDSLVHYPKFGTLNKSLGCIIRWLKKNGVDVYNMNPKSFYVERDLMEYKEP